MNILDVVLENCEFNKVIFIFNNEDIGYFNIVDDEMFIVKVSKNRKTKINHSRKEFDYCTNHYINYGIKMIFYGTINMYDTSHETFHCFKNSKQFIDFIHMLNRDSIKFIQKIGDKLKLYKGKDNVRFFDLRENYELYILFNEHTDDFMIYDVYKINEIMKKRLN